MSGEERTVMFRLPTQVSGQLNCLQGSVVGQSFQLTAGTFVIGRQADCDLHLPVEPGVSKVHAKIVAEGERYFLLDHESRNGTILNGQAVQRAELVDGAEIQICGCRLRFTQTGGPGSIDIKNSVAAVPDVTASVVAPSVAFSPLSSASGAVANTLSSSPVPVPPASIPVVASAANEASLSLSRQEKSASLLDVNALAAQVSPAVIEKGSLFPSFLLGLLSVLILGGGASAALLFLDEDSLPVTAGVATSVRGEKQLNENLNKTEEAPILVVKAGADAGLAVRVEMDAGALATRKKRVQGAALLVDAGLADKSGPQDAGAHVKSDAGRKTESGSVNSIVDKGDESIAAADVSWVAIQFPVGKKLPIRTSGSGRIKEVSFRNGDFVKRGGVLAVLKSAVKASTIATAKESVSTLKSIAESSEGAMEALKEEQAHLRSLLAAQRGARVVIPQQGRLSGLNLKVGDKVRARQVVGFVTRSGEGPSALVRSKKKFKAKQNIEVRFLGGAFQKIKIKRVKKEGKAQRLFFDANDVKKGCEVQIKLL